MLGQTELLNRLWSALNKISSFLESQRDVFNAPSTGVEFRFAVKRVRGEEVGAAVPEELIDLCSPLAGTDLVVDGWIVRETAEFVKL